MPRSGFWRIDVRVMLSTVTRPAAAAVSTLTALGSPPKSEITIETPPLSTFPASEQPAARRGRQSRSSQV